MILDKTYLGSTEIGKMYLGADVVYDSSGNPELFPQDNVLSNITEVDAIPNPPIKPNGSTTVDVAGVGKTDTTTAQNGQWCMLVESTANYSSVDVLMDLEGGQTYRIEFYVQRGTATQVQSRQWGGFDVSPIVTVSNTGWQLISEDVTVSGTGTQACYARIYATYGTPNLNIYVDNFSIKKL